jgi:hypothetical protein
MQLRSIIRHGMPAKQHPVLAAIIAIPASSGAGAASPVARLAKIAAPQGSPSDWLTRMEARPIAVPAARWTEALTVLSDLIEAGTIADALALGWHPLEIIGLQRRLPHDLPNVAGLIYSVRPGERVRLLTDRGCTIDTGTGPHRWVRVPLSPDVAFPWELQI